LNRAKRWRTCSRLSAFQRFKFQVSCDSSFILHTSSFILSSSPPRPPLSRQLAIQFSRRGDPQANEGGSREARRRIPPSHLFHSKFNIKHRGPQPLHRHIRLHTSYFILYPSSFPPRPLPPLRSPLRFLRYLLLKKLRALRALRVRQSVNPPSSRTPLLFDTYA
jgi:hypothetical protein